MYKIVNIVHHFIGDKMKKTIFTFFIMIIIYVVIGSAISSSNIIPEEAIRIRIIANSNSEYDQKIKLEVKKDIEAQMYQLLKNSKNIDEVRTLINGNLIKIENTVNTTLHNNNYDMPFDINFGYNYFPSKKYKGIIYNEGYYESLVITLGSGLGDNWWCVLFPPLCILEATESTDVEYTTMVKNIIDKYF